MIKKQFTFTDSEADFIMDYIGRETNIIKTSENTVSSERQGFVLARGLGYKPEE